MTHRKRFGVAAAVTAAVLLAWIVNSHAGDDKAKAGKERPGAEARQAALEQVLKATNRVRQELDRAEEDYENFRQQNPLASSPEKTVGRRVEVIETAYENSILRLAEIAAQLESLEGVQQDGTDSQAVLLLVSRLPGGNCVQMLRGEKKEAAPAELVKHYVASLKLEQKYLARQQQKLKPLHEAAREQRFEAAKIQDQDKRYRDKIKLLSGLLQPLMERLQVIQLDLDTKESEKKKDK